jgi:PEP-CTERM motif-containing protein
MRRVLLLAVLALALPLTVWADSSIDIVNVGGTITGDSSGLSLTGSTIFRYGSTQGNLGTVSFTTGAFLTGDPLNGGTLAAGGSFTIMGNGTNGVPNGTIFDGTFSGTATWLMIPLADGSTNYVLTGPIADSNGHVGATTQITLNTGKGFFSGIGLSSGDTNLSAVPEPGTLGLLGTGLVGVAGLMRRKMRIG